MLENVFSSITLWLQLPKYYAILLTFAIHLLLPDESQEAEQRNVETPLPLSETLRLAM